MAESSLWARLRAWVLDLNLLPRVVGGLATALLIAVLGFLATLVARGWRNPAVFAFAASIIAVLLAAAGFIWLAARIKRVDERVERGFDSTSVPLPISVRDADRALLQVMGVDVGRTKLFCGVLTVPSSAASGLPGYGLEVSRTQEIEGAIDRDVYRRIVAAARVAAKQVGRLDGIGIGVPGQVDAAEGVITRSPAGFRNDEPFVETLIDEISTSVEVLQAFGISGRDVGEAERHAMRQMIHLDNDVNCGARVLLNGHLDNRRWTNFACIFIGTGAGAGLVLNKEIFYGRYGAAGEIGHISVGGLPGYYDVAARGDVIGAGDSCACGHEGAGVHWERLVSGIGLVNTCRTLEPNLFDVLREGSGGEVTPVVISSAAARCFGSGGHFSEPLGQTHTLSGAVDCSLFKDSLRSVLDHHAQYLSVGIANLVNLLNLDHVVLGGGVMEGLMSLPLYREQVNRHLRTHLLDMQYRTLRVETFPEGRAKSAWQGGALMFFDRSYLKHRNLLDDR